MKKDIYFILGEQTDNQWQVKIYINPFVSFIWLGVVIMLYSGLIGVIENEQIDYNFTFDISFNYLFICFAIFIS